MRRQLSCVAGEDGFRALREQVLGTCDIRRQPPHLTLAHPRNPRAPGNSLAHASTLPESFELTFPEIQLIEQLAGEHPLARWWAQSSAWSRGFVQ